MQGVVVVALELPKALNTTTALFFSNCGFAPERPWGLVFSSHDNFGADCCWIPAGKKRTRILGSSRSFRKVSRKASTHFTGNRADQALATDARGLMEASASFMGHCVAAQISAAERPPLLGARMHTTVDDSNLCE
jgi:hypothetical protein